MRLEMKTSRTAVLLTLTGVVTLCFLGTWQLQRLAWKNDIITRLDQAQKNEEENLKIKDLQNLGLEELPLAYGSVNGTLLSGQEILIGPKTKEGEIGYHLVTPLKMKKGGTILINRGWVPENSKDPKHRAHLKARGNVRFTGIFRKPDWNMFTSRNSPKNDLWFRGDIDEIAQAKGLSNTAPVMLYAQSASRKFDAHQMHAPGWRPRNEHKQYALFWFGMAGILLIIFGIYTFRRR